MLVVGSAFVGGPVVHSQIFVYLVVVLVELRALAKLWLILQEGVWHGPDRLGHKAG